MTTTEQKIRSIQADLIGLAGYSRNEAFLTDLKIMAEKLNGLKAELVPIMEELEGLENPVAFVQLARKKLKTV